MLPKVRSAALLGVMFFVMVGLWPGPAEGQSTNSSSGPDPREIPLPPINTRVGVLPGVKDLPVHADLPDALTMNSGQKVTTVKQWKNRREEIKRILEYYAIGQMPPPPGNVKGEEIKSQLVLDGKVKYRLVHLTFGPKGKLELDIGIFTPTDGPGPFPAVIMPGGTPPGATPLPTLAHPPGQGKGVDALLPVVPITPSTNEAASSVNSTNPPAGVAVDWITQILKRWPGGTANCFAAVMPTLCSTTMIAPRTRRCAMKTAPGLFARRDFIPRTPGMTGECSRDGRGVYPALWIISKPTRWWTRPS